MDICEQAARQPTAELPPELAALPTVTTGGGVELPRTPAWEGLGTGEWSLPPGANAADTAAAGREAEINDLRGRVAAAIMNRQRSTDP